jgi:hypothetical protein
MPKVFDQTRVAADEDLTSVLMTQEDRTTPTDFRKVSLQIAIQDLLIG